MQRIIDRCSWSWSPAIMAALVVHAAALAPSAEAQAPGVDTARAAQPAPARRTFALVEAGIFKPVHSSIRRAPSVSHDVAHAFGTHVTVELGAMANVGRRSALGATVLWGVGSAGSRRTGIRGRYRHWLTDSSSIDVAAGPTRVTSHWGFQGAGVTADLRYKFRDEVALTARVDRLLSADFATGHAAYVGATLDLATRTQRPEARPSRPDTASRAARPGRTFCWRGNRAPACRAFVLFEAGLYMQGSNAIRAGPAVHQWSAGEVPAAFGNHGTWELGAMANVGGRSAVGATALFGLGGADSERAGARARYRHWLTGETSIDAAAGLVRVSLPDRHGQPSGVSTTADLRLNFRDSYALTGRVDWPRNASFATGHATYVGVTLGSKAAVVGTGVALVVGIVGAAVVAGGT